MQKKRKIAILTGGGDCPGMNAVIRAVAKKAILDYGMEVVGFEDGFEGVVKNRHRKLSFEDVSGIITLGGTLLGTSNTADPYRYPVKKGGEIEFKDVSKEAIAIIENLGIDCLVCIGGDGTLSIANHFCRDGIPVIGIPKTIDNDVLGTDITFGFDTAVFVATESIDRIHTTAQSHHRAMVIEVMGRNAGWIALYSGIASGGDVILIPEIPFDINVVAEKISERNRRGKRYTIVVVAEGSKPVGGKVVIQGVEKENPYSVRLGGIGNALCPQIEDLTGVIARAVVLGHLQRSGIPTPFDRVLATRLGAKAVDFIVEENYGKMVAVRGTDLIPVPLEEAASGQRNVPVDSPLIAAGRSVGTCFGDRC